MDRQASRATSKELLQRDYELDRALRPKRLSDFIGQDAIKQNLQVFIEASKLRGKPLDHVLLSGPPGLGKTTLASIIANELEVGITITSGPALESKKDLASILTNLDERQILFIDEVHRLSRPVEEMLYPALEEYFLDIMIGKGPSARPLRFGLKPFTLVGATTRFGLLTSPLRDRFGVVCRLDFYSVEELKEIVLRSASILGINISDDAAVELAKRARGTPRIANRLLKRVADYALVEKREHIKVDLVKTALEKLGIDELGLDSLDLKILETIVKKYRGGPVGLNTISVSIDEEPTTIEEVYEPYLLRLGMINRTPRGRTATKMAYEHLGVDYKEGKLF